MMAMIGGFLGWQPTLLVLAASPLCGVVIALAVAAVSSRGFVGFGPYLAAGTVVVLCTWRWLWAPLRNTFGDWISLAILGGAAFVALLVLLGFARLYRTMPVRRE
jgi:leader peptidase (prepilin peptidase)/N-methyltransferase